MIPHGPLNKLATCLNLAKRWWCGVLRRRWSYSSGESWNGSPRQVTKTSSNRSVVRLHQARSDRMLREEIDASQPRQPFEGCRRTLAQVAAGRTPASQSGSDSASRRELHGHGGRSGGRREDSGARRAAHSGTRLIRTTAGILSHHGRVPLPRERIRDPGLPVTAGHLLSPPIANRCLIATAKPVWLGHRNGADRG